LIASLVRRPGRSRAAGARGFTLIEIMIAASVIAVCGMAGIAYITRATQGADYSRDRVFARQKAMSILSELRAYVEGGKGEVAADLDGFDDGIAQNATLSIQPDPLDPGAFIQPDHKLSGNFQDVGQWRWYRRITVRHFPGVTTRDLRICTVRLFRHFPNTPLPGEQMAEVSSVVRTVGDAYPTTQVYDVYLLALESVPGWWVYMDSIKPFIDATLADLEARNPGLEFRTHWITTTGYGRDEQYAPYTNETRISTDSTAWGYVYPGKLPAGSSAVRYYVPDTMKARVNLDGNLAPTFANDLSAGETFTDSNGNSLRDAGEPFVDSNGNTEYDVGNPVPYAMADQFNHCMRAPDEDAKFAARVAAGQDVDETPTWRMLLDRMIADPAKYHNTILINLHGELLPMPPVRNYSDASKDPVSKPGWRAVAHPELLRPRRTQGNDALSDAPRWRVYGYKTEFTNTENLTSQKEPFTDVNKDGAYNAGEPFQDWNANGQWNDEWPITMEIAGINCAAAINAGVNPSLIIKRLAGGIDANGDGTADPYTAFANAMTYPETFNDANGDGVCNVVEPYFDLNGNGAYDAGEPFQDLDANGLRSGVAEPFTDSNGNARWDKKAPADVYTESTGNTFWNGAEPFLDNNTDGVRNGPTAAPPLPVWRAWNPAIDNINAATRAAYCASYGEPWNDLNANTLYNAAEVLLYDSNGNGVFDGGWTRGEMWYEAFWDSVAKATVVTLHGTPLRTPETADSRGLDATARLYDLDYLPCPMINTAPATVSQFERDLNSAAVDVPKNTARWTLELPLAQVRKGWETAVGANNGDATDRVLSVTTRLGTDRTTGPMWPTKNRPENLSKSYSYFYSDAGKVPFSERYQFQGDPRNCPYADLDRYGGPFANGYNWYFDNFKSSGTDKSANYLAFDTARLAAGWMGRNQVDTARYMYWLRQAITKTEAVYTTLTGFSYYYLSVGGDVGYDSANGFASSIPVDGARYNMAGSIFEDTIAGGGTAGVGGSQKFLRSANGAAAGIRSGGYWWSKPWMGELFQDSAFAGQWAPWGNLRAATGTAALTYQQMRRGSVVAAQQPAGTLMPNLVARTAEEGSTSLFTVGSAAATFHHQYQDGMTGNLVGDGPQLAANYNFPMPTTAPISRPFDLGVSADGGTPPEFGYTTDYPHYSASTVVNFYDHVNTHKGSALVRLTEPGGTPRAGFIVVNGIDRTTGSGSAFIARYSLLTLVHSYFAAGLAGTGRIKQLPRAQITSPTIITELTNPGSIAVSWKTEWTRWDGKPYTTAFAPTFTENESDLVYVPLYSKDGGRTWLNMKNNTTAQLGKLPWVGGVPDPALTINDGGAGNETWTWPTPAGTFPEGSYIIRIEGYRKSEPQHYSQHQEKIYVNR
jgi:prepilin-type N-terminal cleavage/methylation domain-containing protein